MYAGVRTSGITGRREGEGGGGGSTRGMIRGRKRRKETNAKRGRKGRGE